MALEAFAEWRVDGVPLARRSRGQVLLQVEVRPDDGGRVLPADAAV